MDSKMISQKLDRQFVFEGVKLIIQLNDQNPGCDQCMRFLDYYSRFALQSGDKELLLLVNIVIIGEIGGTMEVDAAYWIKDNFKKPVVGFIAGQTAPKGRRMGHAGAIIGGANDTAAAKMKIMGECGIHVVESPAFLGKTLADVLK